MSYLDGVYPKATQMTAKPKEPKLKLEAIPSLLQRQAKKKIKPLTELQQQSRLVTWINETAAMQSDVEIAEALTWIHSIANGHARMNPVARMNAMREGMRAGVLDKFCPYPSSGYHGLYIEMKRRDGVLSQDQANFIAYLDRVNYKHGVCHTWNAAAWFVVSWYGLEEHAPIPDQNEDDAAISRKAAAVLEIKAIKARNVLAEKAHKRAMREYNKAVKLAAKVGR